MNFSEPAPSHAPLWRDFSHSFGAPNPTYQVHVPGRVNLIGEHIDYNGLSVLPMAIQLGITSLCRPRTDTRIRFVNSDAQFEEREFDVGSDIEPYDIGDWGNYLKAAAQALAIRCGSLCGCDVLVESSLPIAAGLSSSSALVVCSALAILGANDIRLDSLELAELMAHAERYTGTQGGGMDQAICLGALEGHVTRIDFDPVRLTHTAVPSDWDFVVAHSLVMAEKSGARQGAYNQRTEQCSKALRVVAGHLGMARSDLSYRTLMESHVSEELVEMGAALMENSLARVFKHVVTEVARVSGAEEAIRQGDLSTLGGLMADSHRSLRDDYEVSCPELDKLVSLAMNAGADGARLTGAGFGGCAIVLCREDRTDAVLQSLADGYYRKRRPERELEKCLFRVRPSSGAVVTEIG